MTFRARCNRGWSLAESALVATVVAVLAATSVPLLLQAQARWQLRAEVEALQRGLTYARLRALSQQRWVSVCGSQDGLQCSGDWQAGWLIFVHDRTDVQPRQPEDVVAVHHPHRVRLAVSTNAPVQSHIRYAPSGFTRQANGAFQAGTVRFCHDRHPTAGEARLIINRVGRVRLEWMEHCGL